VLNGAVWDGLSITPLGRLHQPIREGAGVGIAWHPHGSGGFQHRGIRMLLSSPRKPALLRGGDRPRRVGRGWRSSADTAGKPAWKSRREPVAGSTCSSTDAAEPVGPIGVELLPMDSAAGPMSHWPKNVRRSF